MYTNHKFSLCRFNLKFISQYPEEKIVSQPLQLSKNVHKDECHKGKIEITTIATENEFDSKNLEHAKAEGSASRSLCGDKQQVKKSDTDIVERISAKLYQAQQFSASTTEKSFDNKRSSNSIGDQRSTYGRLRVATTPSNQIGKSKLSSELFSLQDQDNPDQDSSRTSKPVACQREPQSNRRSATSTNLRPSSSGIVAGSGAATGSASASTQRPNCVGTAVGSFTAKSIGTGDHSVTQFALIDDENVSALQQVTKGGGALTLASQWKSQFDDSEDTTDNEWKQEPQVTH